MNARERYVALTHYRPFDRPFQWEFDAYEETLKRWRREGMPADEHLSSLAGYDRFETTPVRTDLYPAFDAETLEESSEYTIYRDGDGVIKKKIHDIPEPAMPQYVKFGLATREDWKEYKKRLNPASPARYPLYMDSLVTEYKVRDYPLGISAGSMFGLLRNWIGMENIAMMLYDDRALVEEMMEYMADFFVAILKRVVTRVQFDCAVLWEDMACKGGPLISPRHVRELMVPGYRKIVDCLHRAGIDIVMLDSDGDVSELIPIWLECGINFIYPMEVASGMDVVKLRKRFGKELRMQGGMDKRVIAGRKEGIRQMVAEKRDLILEGGYIPGIDHSFPPDISWDNFLYYRKLLNEIR